MAASGQHPCCPAAPPRHESAVLALLTHWACSSKGRRGCCPAGAMHVCQSSTTRAAPTTAVPGQRGATLHCSQPPGHMQAQPGFTAWALLRCTRCPGKQLPCKAAGWSGAGCTPSAAVAGCLLPTKRLVQHTEGACKLAASGGGRTMTGSSAPTLKQNIHTHSQNITGPMLPASDIWLLWHLLPQLDQVTTQVLFMEPLSSPLPLLPLHTACWGSSLDRG